jgi:Ca-activated chloride channel family protein
MTDVRASLTLALAALFPLLMGMDVLRSRSKAVEEGNAQLQAGKPAEALARYDEAANKLGGDPGVHFNRGAALYGLSRWDEAAAAFLRATEARTPPQKASAFYNLGNSLFQGKKYGEAAEAFKKSLAYDPADVKAKWNLELALRHKQEEDKKQENDDKNKDNKDSKDGKKDDKNGQKGKEQDQQAKNEDQKDDKKDNQDDKNKGNDKNEPDPQAKNDPAKQQEQQQADQKPEQKQDQKPPESQAKQGKQDKDAQKQPPGQAGQASDKQPPKSAEMREVDAILDNLERSPKALEQELARIRALNRRPPAKDW